MENNIFIKSMMIFASRIVQSELRGGKASQLIIASLITSFSDEADNERNDLSRARSRKPHIMTTI